jgi:integrase
VVQPIEAAMIEAIDAYTKPKAGTVTPLAFLLNKGGQPYTAKGLSNAVKDWMAEAGLPHCSAHSVRKGTLTFLADRGRTVHEIAARGGHKSLAMVALYTKKADQLRLARAAATAFQDEAGTEVSTMPVAGDKKSRKA